ncbi:MAG: hypothetical protein FWH02_03315 [Oscillospiraceae bacterium]|nr:hypothetical protein [Oscillospiraceae bacterium]
MKNYVVLLLFIAAVVLTVPGCGGTQNAPQDDAQSGAQELFSLLEESQNDLKEANSIIKSLRDELKKAAEENGSQDGDIHGLLEESRNEAELARNELARANSRIEELEKQLSELPEPGSEVDLARAWTELANRVAIFMLNNLPQYNPVMVYAKSTKVVPDYHTQIDIWIEPQSEAAYYNILDMVWSEFAHAQDNGLFVHAVNVNWVGIAQEPGIE